MASPLMLSCQESVWYDRWRYDDAELSYHECLARQRCGGAQTTPCKGSTVQTHATSFIAHEIAKAREHIQKSLQNDISPCGPTGLTSKLDNIEKENRELKQLTHSLEEVVKRLESRIAALEVGCKAAGDCTRATACTTTCPVPACTEATTNGAGDDDDFDLFADESEDEDAERVKQERVKAYEDKKSKKVQLIAKSNVILDVKPWDDETDMAELEKCVRTIEMDGLLWGASKLVPLAYGIKKLQISCVVEDEKVSIDDLEEKITAFEDFVQSTDIAAFNRI